MSEKIKKAAFNKNPNIGLFSFATNKYCVYDYFGKKKDETLLSDILKVDVIRSRMLGTGLVGIFAAGNSKGIMVSNMLYDEEIDALRDEILSLSHNIEFFVLDTRYSAVGNLILCNDNGCVISEKIKELKDDIESFLDVNVSIGRIAGSYLIGSSAICTNEGCVVNKNASGDEIEQIRKVLGVNIVPATVNFGSIWLKSGIIANSNGLLIGEESTGAEMGNIAEALGFV